MAADAPIAFLAFANATDVHLQLLKSESRTLFEILEPLQAAGRIAIRREESCALDELYGDLVAGGERIVLFHYAGHADGDRLELEGGAGGREGMARLLGRLAGLKLVVLNGCATAGHVHALLD
ncbi:MAG: hypothetical protein V2J24_20265, partial [Pseudomonadales bacterium]|nr:hypothetical protein [Pseudomonadales bacterium]